MKARIRIYRVHDYDLMRYYFGKKNGYVTFSGLIKQLVRSRMKGEELKIPRLLIPGTGNFPYRIETTVCFKEDADADIIEWLGNIVPRQRNGFLKNLLRQGMAADDFTGCYMMQEIRAPSENRVPAENANSGQIKTSDSRPVYKKSVPKQEKPETIKKVPYDRPDSDTKETYSEPEADDVFDLFGALEKMIER